jgi:HEAT repeat protein
LLQTALTAIWRAHGNDVSNGIENAFGEMNAAVIASSVEGLTNPDCQDRKLAAMSLRSLGVNDREITRLLRSRLRDESIAVRIEAAAAVLKSDNQNRTAMSILTGALAHPDPWFRRRTAALVGEIGPAAEALVPFLEEAFSDVDPTVRVVAAEAVIRIDSDNDTGIQCLISLLEANTRDVHQVMAIDVLEQFPSRAAAAIPVLRKLRFAPHSNRLTSEAADALHGIHD